MSILLTEGADLSNAGIIGPETKLGEGKEQMNAAEVSKRNLDNETFQVSQSRSAKETQCC